ncbi:hypothetical protein WMF31_25675 [Sorangium sp. So ce1036]
MSLPVPCIPLAPLVPELEPGRAPLLVPVPEPHGLWVPSVVP